ncbi:DUF2744 domain-containing protein [Nocardia sp. NBC_01503]|uniref:phage gene 29 protein family protein n=1 Tax=Nocardia sp. NBC_01503 TaxID=2975997 RepID=UPI002E7B8B5A|nr:DUF2744 domain-containing protein [Nocardia sp. NBC_01503]WTL35625.1 DUF2744 domain-containing protein [Nocardia sp. NBC_01503]
MSIPLHEHCDQDTPEEAFVWALIGLPGPRNSPLMVHPETLGEWSKHLWDLGFRHAPEDQTKEYHPPARGHHHWLNGLGQWLPQGTDRVVVPDLPDVTAMTAEERAHVVRQLRDHGDLAHLVDRPDAD